MPGGVLDPDDVVGRADELGLLLRYVASGGAYVVGDRRMGKTSLLRLMVRDLRAAGHVVVMLSAETGSLNTVEERLLIEIRKEGVLGRAWRSWSKEFEGEVRLGVRGAGLRLTGNLRRPGSMPETDLFTLCDRAAKDAGAASVVLVIDEIAVLTLLLQERDEDATEFLRALRRVRQDESLRVRVVLAGSVGLHHTLDDSTVINDLPRVQIGPLRHGEAVILARRLLISVTGADDPDLAERIASEVSDIPYYVQKIVADLPPDPGRAAAVDVSAKVDQALDENAWDADHYVKRLSAYFDPRGHAIALECLDSLAASGRISLADLARELGSRLDPPPSRPELSDVLEKLRQDHYLAFADGEYGFSTPFLQRVWLRIRTRLA